MQVFQPSENAFSFTRKRLKDITSFVTKDHQSTLKTVELVQVYMDLISKCIIPIVQSETSKMMKSSILKVLPRYKFYSQKLVKLACGLQPSKNLLQDAKNPLRKTKIITKASALEESHQKALECIEKFEDCIEEAQILETELSTFGQVGVGQIDLGLLNAYFSQAYFADLLVACYSYIASEDIDFPLLPELVEELYIAVKDYKETLIILLEHIGFFKNKDKNQAELEKVIQELLPEAKIKTEIKRRGTDLFCELVIGLPESFLKPSLAESMRKITSRFRQKVSDPNFSYALDFEALNEF